MTISAFENAGQKQVFRFWQELNEEQRENLLSQAREIDLDEVNQLAEDLVLSGEGQSTDLSDLEPAPYVTHPAHGGDGPRWERARELGEAKLREGKVAAFTVAGGQGTRLGYDGPKGTFPVTPVKEKTLFQVFAEKILAASRRYDCVIPWFVMTSHANHAATESFFEENDYFGLNPEHVMLFMQGRMPAVDKNGKILLSDKDSIAMSPDGHGGSLRALVRSGAVKKMKELGVEALSYFQVDNPLVQVIDPAFIGFHFDAGSEMSSKMIPKAYPLEKVGHFCIQNDRMVVIEYSDMPEEMQKETDDNGELRFNAGSIAIHVLSVDFVERVGRGDSDFKLPFHRADKKIPTVDDSGRTVKPEKPNGVKFEMFVFDALPFAKQPIVIETLREDDFSPVKNAEGQDSPETCKNDQMRQWARWLKAARAPVSTDDSGLPTFTFEVSPLFADTERAFVAKWNRLEQKPVLEDGAVLEG